MVRINVIKFAVSAQTQTWGDWNHLFSPQRLEKAPVQSGEITDKSQPTFHFIVNQGFGPKTLRVSGGYSYRRLPVRGYGARQTLVQQARKNHSCHIARFAVGDPQ